MRTLLSLPARVSLRPSPLAFNPDAPRRLSTSSLTPFDSAPTSLGAERPSVSRAARAAAGVRLERGGVAERPESDRGAAATGEGEGQAAAAVTSERRTRDARTINPLDDFSTFTKTTTSTRRARASSLFAALRAPPARDLPSFIPSRSRRAVVPEQDALDARLYRLVVQDR